MDGAASSVASETRRRRRIMAVHLPAEVSNVNVFSGNLLLGAQSESSEIFSEADRVQLAPIRLPNRHL
jgi:hypothetical protein